MNSFVHERDLCWFHVKDEPKGSRSLSVTSAFLPYLKRYRISRGLPELPLPLEHVPLLKTSFGRPGLRARHIRESLTDFFDLIAQELESAGWDCYQSAQIRHAPASLLKRIGVRDAVRTKSPQRLQHDVRHMSNVRTFELNGDEETYY